MNFRQADEDPFMQAHKVTVVSDLDSPWECVAWVALGIVALIYIYVIASLA